MRSVQRLVAVAVAVVTVSAGAVVPANAITVHSTSIEVSGLNPTQAARIQLLWDEFVEGMSAHSECLLASRPEVVADPSMRPRAAYAPSTGILYVKPGDLDRLVVFHELAHHLDFTCGAAGEIGAEFRRAQGIDASKPWWQSGAPVTWPAEYFANAVAMSLGEHSSHGVTQESIDLVTRWASGPPPPRADLTLDEPRAVSFLPV